LPFIFFILLSTLVFTGIIMILVVLLLFIEAKIIKKCDCKIQINDDKNPFLVPSGSNLLMTLSNNNIFLPSACGGGGTCAMCKCQVLEGGGSILPTETGLLTRKEIKNHYRLSCQMKMRNDISIKIPDEIFNVKKYECTVLSNKNVATFIKELVLELPSDQELDFKAGGYIQIDVPEYNIFFKDFVIENEYKPDWDEYKLWDLHSENEEEVFRAYSMASFPKEKKIVKLNIRIATPPTKKRSLPPGICSSYVFNLKPKDKVTISGPYGEFFIKDSNREMMYIGGGAGMAPMRSHLFHLFKTLKTNRKVSFWYGARSKREIFYEDDFKELSNQFSNLNFNVALSEPLSEDKWKGYTGFIHKAVYENYLKNHEEPEEIEYYLCGPPLMVEAVEAMLDSLGVPPEMIMFDKF